MRSSGRGRRHGALPRARSGRRIRVPGGGARPRRGRRPAPPTLPELAGRTVLIAGLFPASVPDPATVMAALAAELAARGAVVAGSHVQRRGVSRGGVRAMSRPLSATTVLGSGKLRALAAERAATEAAAVIFSNRLTGRQRVHLAAALGCPVLDRTDLMPRSAPAAPDADGA
ncbi:hypothetical protein AB0C96_12770 [Streptomyces sp. NPDC048506]|uniref:HflX-like GTP-binding protein n=1 Tax=Streptomyces sp. NPDC048506 TaxID=3155028 RepID=UPI003422E29F